MLFSFKIFINDKNYVILSHNYYFCCHNRDSIQAQLFLPTNRFHGKTDRSNLKLPNQRNSQCRIGKIYTV